VCVCVCVCVCVTQNSVTRKFSVLKDVVLYVRNIFILLQSYYKFPKRTRKERKIFWSLLAIPPQFLPILRSCNLSRVLFVLSKGKRLKVERSECET